jgi:hypothetical protein
MIYNKLYELEFNNNVGDELKLELSSTNKNIQKTNIIDIELNQNSINDDNRDNIITHNSNYKQEKTFFGIKIFEVKRPFKKFDLFLGIFYICYFVNLILNFVIGGLDNKCVNYFDKKTNMSISIFLIVTGTLELISLWLIFYEFTYLNHYKIRDKFEGLFTILCLIIITIINQVISIIGLVLFFSNIDYYKNTCSENIYNYIFFEMFIGILVLFPFSCFVVYFVIQSICDFFRFHLLPKLLNLIN